jgi:hypothetical protein
MRPIMKVFADGALKAFLDARDRGAPVHELQALKMAAEQSRNAAVSFEAEPRAALDDSVEDE